MLKSIRLKHFSFSNLLMKYRELGVISYKLLKKNYSYKEISNAFHVTPSRVKNWAHKAKESKILKYGSKTFFNDIKINVNWFIKNSKSKNPRVKFTDQQKDYIIELLISDWSTNYISKGAHVAQPIISYLRNRKRTIDKLSFATANKLINFYRKHKSWQTKLGLLIFGSKLTGRNQLICTRIYSEKHPYFGLIGKDYKIGFKNHETKIVTAGKIPKSLLNQCKLYANLPVNMKCANDMQYMERDLEQKLE